VAPGRPRRCAGRELTARTAKQLIAGKGRPFPAIALERRCIPREGQSFELVTTSQVRIRLSNRYGTKPLHVTGATIAKAGPGAAVTPTTLRPLTFGCRLLTTIPVGADATSDAAWLPVSALEKVTVTLYFAGPTGPATFHEGGLTTTYRAAGDHRFDQGAAAFTGEASHSWYHLTGVDVAGAPRRAEGTVVTFGDSITDGYGSTLGADNRYSDELAERLVAAGRPVSVVNAGINGNKLLADSPCYGEKGVTRFHRDVIGQPRVRTAIVLLGLNDIGAGEFPDFGCGAFPVVTAAQVIEAHRTLIRAACAHGIRIVGATLTPMKGAYGYDTEANEAVRDAVNEWIRTSGEYDVVVDLDRVLADPAEPDALLAAYDSGDHLHPNDAARRRSPRPSTSVPSDRPSGTPACCACSRPGHPSAVAGSCSSSQRMWVSQADCLLVARAAPICAQEAPVARAVRTASCRP
jgi:lysophospholipase L1-like esterase